MLHSLDVSKEYFKKILSCFINIRNTLFNHRIIKLIYSLLSFFFIFYVC